MDLQRTIVTKANSCWQSSPASTEIGTKKTSPETWIKSIRLQKK